MNKAPAFQFYAAEYLADENVQLMSLEEEGCYIRLVAFCWREGSIPADLGKLSRLSKGASEDVLRVVVGCFTEHPSDPARLLHKRLEAEREKQREWREKSSEGGKKSASKRAAERSVIPSDAEVGDESRVVARVVAPPSQPSGNTAFASSSSSSTAQRSKSKKQTAGVKDGFELPSWIDPEAWEGYEEMRENIRKPMTKRARERVITRLGEFAALGQNPNEILDTSVRSNWADVYELKPNQGGTHGTNRSNEYVSPAALRRQRSNAAIDAAVERARDADEAGEGFLSESRDRGGNERPLLESVGRDSGQIQDAPFRDGALERFEKVGFLSSPVRH